MLTTFMLIMSCSQILAVNFVSSSAWDAGMQTCHAHARVVSMIVGCWPNTAWSVAPAVCGQTAVKGNSSRMCSLALGLLNRLLEMPMIWRMVMGASALHEWLFSCVLQLCIFHCRYQVVHAGLPASWTAAA
ncbi:hypothetical protein COO60DRAFT_1559220, partial [Scenedesmus sp. NREL 46B-D3]